MSPPAIGDWGLPTPYVADADFALYVGDALTVLQGLPDESVDCVVTSPPYWGLRDYGTGEWEGGDENCDHVGPPRASDKTGLSHRNERPPDQVLGQPSRLVETPYRDVCGKCGARRVDQQLGLEPTPDQYVTRMVEVFREVRRVLARHGTCWVNLGSSYASGDRDGHGTRIGAKQGTNRASAEGLDNVRPPQAPGFKQKDMVPIPWMVAMALQQDGWYLRADVIWSKPNPMPESVTDRPTKAHEYVFLLTKQPRYYYDGEAIREAHKVAHLQQQNSEPKDRGDQRQFRKQGLHDFVNPNGRNARSVWEIATQPYPEAHFATFPEELARRCILAGCPERVCRVCGKPSERIVEREYGDDRASDWAQRAANGARSGGVGKNFREVREVREVRKDCGHNDYRPGICIDPFLGSGTVALVARNHNRHAIGIELSPKYAELAARRTRQLSLLSEGTAA